MFSLSEGQRFLSEHQVRHLGVFQSHLQELLATCRSYVHVQDSLLNAGLLILVNLCIDRWCSVMMLCSKSDALYAVLLKQCSTLLL